MNNQDSQNLNSIMLACLIILCVLLVIVCGAIIYYFVKSSNFGLKRKRNNQLHIFKDKHNKVININGIILFITDFATALARLSSNKVGALIVLENKDSLEKYIQIGNKIDSPFFSEFVYSIFYNHESALHDGAMILRNLRITSLSSYLPTSKRLLPVKYGSRHRAAFGITERTDALAFIVSEATGGISYVHGPDFVSLPNDSVELANKLLSILFNDYYPLSSNKTPIIIEKIKERLSK